MKVFESVGKAFEPARTQEGPQPKLDTRSLANGLARLALVAEPRCDFVSGVVFLNQPVNLGFGDFADALDEVAHPVAIDGVAELHLRGDLIALGNSHFAHVVAEADRKSTRLNSS